MNQRTFRVATVIVVALSSLVLFGCPKKQTVAEPEADIVVAEDGTGDYYSISRAIAKAEPGDVIYVRPGVYEEAVEVDVDDIALVGAGPDRTIIDADGDYAALTLAAEEADVSGFTLRGASSHGIYIKDGHQRVDHCLIVDNEDRGIYFSSFSGSPSADIDHCTIADNDVSGIYSPTDSPRTSITNCIVAYCNRGIVSDENEGGMTVDHNCVYNDSEDFDRVTRGRGNITEDPEFVDPEDGDYRLGPDSPCRGQADDGMDMGCF